MIGGASKSRLQCQILSDITGLPVYLPKNMKLNYACRGAAMLAGVSAKIYKDFKKVNDIFKEDESLILPREEFEDYYSEKFDNYVRVVSKNLQM